MSNKPFVHKGKFSDDRSDTIVSAISSGLRRRDAAAMADISYVSLKQWLMTGELEGSGKFYELYSRVVKAEVERKRSRLEVITRAADDDGDWKAAAWELERRHKGEFAKETNVNLNTDNVEDPSLLTDDELSDRLTELRKKIYG